MGRPRTPHQPVRLEVTYELASELQRRHAIRILALMLRQPVNAQTQQSEPAISALEALVEQSYDRP